MPISIEYIREKINVEPTPQNAGLTLTLKISAYDNGLITVDDRPMASDRRKGVTSDLLSVSAMHEVVACYVNEFIRQVYDRRRI